MKNISKIFIAITLAVGLWSCESEDNFMLVAPQEAAFAIITPDAGSSIVINEATVQTNVAVTFSWEAVSYGTPTEVTYSLELAPNGSEFAMPTVVSSATTRNASMTFAALNTIATAFDTNPDEIAPVAIDVRIKSTIGSVGAEEKYSDVITILVTPFTPTVPPVLVKRELYFVGPASSAGWNNNNDNMPMFREGDNDDLYTYTGYFAADQFKLLEKKGQWQPQWGTNDGTALVLNDGTGSDPNPFASPAAGYFTLVCDITNMTFTMTPFAGDTSTTIPTIGIIGSGTSLGWDASTAMTPSAFDPHLWKVTATLVDGEMKFRANDAWTVNWGGSTALSGTGAQDGPNIPVTAGTYDIWFNDLDGRYLLIPQE